MPTSKKIKKQSKKPELAKKPRFLEGEFNLPSVEENVLKFWDERDIFQKSLAKNATSKRARTFVFYEGPPYANGRPAIHHVLARVVKDVMLRYKTMRGYYVPRRGGWDTHGLPVEMAAEKALGFSSKKDIEAYGIERFNEKAKEQVWIYKDTWELLTKRMGYWLDLENAYVTYAPEYMETIWWTLAQIAKRKLLFKGHKVVPWCTRCGTSLSSHELAQGYKEVNDNSVYVKFKLKPGQQFGEYTTKDSAYILSWTTTPWTLPGNVALAVGEKISYSAIRVNGVPELYILASDLVDTVFKEQQIEIVHNDIKGKDLVGLEYEALFDVKPLQSDKSYKIYPADFVTTTDGTGVVHTAVMYGEDDYALGKKFNLPQKHTVAEDGTFMDSVHPLSGMYVKAKESESKIFQHLENGGNLLRVESYRHEYPHCWRCGTPLLYYARTSWFIGMSSLRKELLARNETINWIPEHVKEGRFGEWLKEAKDWNLSRERYWGTPLPIWECKKCDHAEVVGSLDDLDKLSGEWAARNHYFAMRHGQAFGNEFGIIDSGNQHFKLTAAGKREVEAAARKLKGKKIDIIFSSSLDRAKETAAIVAKTLGVETIHYDKRLHEIFLASLSGTKIEDYRSALTKKPTDEERLANHAAKGAESLKDVRARAWKFLADVEEKYKDKNILIVSHEDTIWMLSQSALGWSDKKAIAMKDGIGGLFMKPAAIVDFMVKQIPRDRTGEVDMHRPFVDDIKFSCPQCKSPMHRVKEVTDVWYDSGAMPFAQAHFPFDQKTKASNPNPGAMIDFPADYIAEGIDQTRGWFYTMLAIATALGYEAPYKNVITFGLLNDKFGNKMSKSKGNVIEPFAVINTYGVDAVRWYFYAGTPFGEPKNFDEQDVAKMFRKTHLIIYNSLVFWKTYAARNAQPKTGNQKLNTKNVLDAWILIRTNEFLNSVTTKLDKYQVREAALEMEPFVDDLSRWYIRRSRKRLQRPDGKKDYEAASLMLRFVLLSVAKITAPFTPFFSEMLYAELGGPKESVHLEDWPSAKRGSKLETRNSKLIQEMKIVRELAALGLAKRAEVKIKVRQPLALMTVGKKLSAKIADILLEEMNVKKIIFNAKLKEGIELDTVITPELREEGITREIARMVQELRQEAQLEPKDAVAVSMELPKDIRSAIEKRESFLKSDVGAKLIEYRRSEKATAQQSAKIEGQDIWVGIKKI